jgi:Uma2 family endonuclease
MATAEALMSAEEFGRRPDPGYPEELVQGRIVAMPPPDRRHGKTCYRTGRIFGDFIEEHDLGHIMTNDSGIITERDPDTVRGADVAFYSYARLPKGPLPAGYGPEVPELVIEVRSPSDTWREILRKVTEYLMAGVLKVIVLDPSSRNAHIYAEDDAPVILGPEDELTIPDILGDFRVAVQRFFD